MIALPFLLLALSVPATVTSVYDGDTIKVQAEIWPGFIWSGSVRVLGIDTLRLEASAPRKRLRRLRLASS